MGMSRQDLEHVAKLAKLDLTSANTATTEQKINSIFEMISTLDKLDVTDVAPLTHPLDIHQPLREDLVHAAGTREEIEQISDHINHHLYVVPQVLDNDS